MRSCSSVTRGGEGWADRWHEFRENCLSFINPHSEVAQSRLRRRKGGADGGTRNLMNLAIIDPRPTIQRITSSSGSSMTLCSHSGKREPRRVSATTVVAIPSLSQQLPASLFISPYHEIPWFLAAVEGLVERGTIE